MKITVIYINAERAALCIDAVHLFVCPIVYRQKAYTKTRFSKKKLSNLELWSLLTTNT